MAHWAEIDENSIVKRVVVTSNEEPDEGYQWLVDNLGGIWIQTSYNTWGNEHKNGGIPLRKNYAGKGFTYDPIRDAFIPPKPSIITMEKNYLDWVLNEETCLWEGIEVPLE